MVKLLPAFGKVGSGTAVLAAGYRFINAWLI